MRGPNAFRSAAALHDPEILRRKGLMSAERGIWPLMTFDGKTVGDSAGWSIALSLSDAELAVRVLPALRGADSALTARAG